MWVCLGTGCLHEPKKWTFYGELKIAKPEVWAGNVGQNSTSAESED